MIWIYYILTQFCFILALPFLPWILLFSKKRRINLIHRLGFFSKPIPKAANTKRIWIHALSVGEVRSALPLIQALNKKIKKQNNNNESLVEIVFSVSTITGYKMAKELFDSEKSYLATDVFYFPFDLCFSLKRVIKNITPDLVCLVETDLWPGFLHTMHCKHIPVILVNARMSISSMKGYVYLGGNGQLFFKFLSQVLAQTEQDKISFEQLGVNSSKIHITGNFKFDMKLPSMTDKEKSQLRWKLGLKDNSLIWIAGSTHEGEEQAIIEIFIKLNIPELSLILAPRNPKRCEKLVPIIKRYGCSLTHYSKNLFSGESPNVILIDIIGVLAQTYAICDLAFIGGSLVPKGGHNPLEPAMYEKPILFGPDMSDFQEIAKIMKKNNAALEVKNKDEMYKAVQSIISDQDLAKSMGKAAKKICRENTGAVDQTIEILYKYLE